MIGMPILSAVARRSTGILPVAHGRAFGTEPMQSPSATAAGSAGHGQDARATFRRGLEQKGANLVGFDPKAFTINTVDINRELGDSRNAGLENGEIQR